MSFIVAEVMETKTAFKPNQKDNLGNSLPIGSIEIRIGGRDSNLGQLKNVFARPATWNRRVPLIGEQVYVLIGPTNSTATDSVANMGYMYFSPLNTTDDLTLHNFPSLFKRDQSAHLPPPGKRLHDNKEVGYTFPKKPKKTDNLQPFEGDDIFEGRLGSSIRFGSTVTGNTGVYDKKPTWKGSSNTDPLTILRVRKPSGSGNQNIGKIGSKYSSYAKYTIEDLGVDDASIYLATTQKLSTFKAGFNKNMTVKSIGNWSGNSQIIADAERIIINARVDKLLLIGSKEVVITGKRILFQDDTYKVYLDDLMKWLKKWLDEDVNLSMGSAMYSTSCGPTSVSTNMGQFQKLKNVDFNMFKKL